MEQEIDPLIALWVFSGTFGVLGGLMLHRHHVQKRQLASGRRLCAARLLRDGTRLVATPKVSVTRPGRLCRLVLAARITGEYRQGPRPLFGKVAMVTGTPYTLTLSDRSGRVLYEERGRLDRFSRWFWSRSSGWSIGSRERSRWTRGGKAVILDFVPREAGVYQVALAMDVRTEVKTERSSSWAEVVEAELLAAEGAEPFSRLVRRAYPHETVEI